MKHHAGTLWLLLVAAAIAAWVATTAPLNRALANLEPLAFALAMVLAMCGLGAPAARLLARRSPAIDQALLSLALGIGLTGAVVFIPGLFGIVDPALYAAWFLLGLGLFVVAALRWWRFEAPTIEWKSPLGALALVIIVAHLLQLLPYAAAPVCSTDALEYHLLISKTHLLEGSIGYIPSLVESNYPGLASFLYMPVLALTADIACKGLHLWIGLAALVVLGRLSRRLHPEGNPLIAPALFLSMPVTNVAWGVAWNDAIFVFFMLIALSRLVEYNSGDERSWRPIFTAGVVFGLAAWTKYTVVMMVLALAPIFIAGLLRWRWRVVHVICFSTPVALLSLLVFAKNLVFTGNPFYPFLHSVFPSPYWNDNAATYFSNGLRTWEIAEWNLGTYLSFPLHITIWPRLIDTQTGILPLALTPLLFFGPKNRTTTLLRLFVGCNILAWLVLHTENRSLFTLFAVLFALTAGVLENLIDQLRSLRRPAILLLALAATANFAVTTVNTLYMTEPLRYFFGLESQHQFLMREAESHGTLSWLNGNAEVEAVLLVGLKRPYYLNKTSYHSAFADPPIAEVITNGATSADQVGARLAEYGVNFIAINRDEYAHDHDFSLYSWPDHQRRAFETFIRERCRVVHRTGVEFVYRID